MRKNYANILLFIGITLFTFSNQVYSQVTKIADINPGSGNSDPRLFTSFQNELIFTANDGIHGNELWKHTESGTELVADINPGVKGSTIKEIYAYGDELIFSADDGLHGTELWKYDGQNVTLLADIRPTADSSSLPTHFIEYQNDLYFLANQNHVTRKIWKYDGVTVSPITDPITDNNSYGEMLVANNLLFFNGKLVGNGTVSKLLKWDGQTIEVVGDGNSNQYGIIPIKFGKYNKSLYFISNYNGWNLCKTDGDTIELLFSFNNIVTTFTGRLWPIDGSVVFRAVHENSGLELWRHDTLSLQTTLVSDIAPGTDWSYPSFFEYFNGKLYFGANDQQGPGFYNYELWEYSQGSIQKYEFNMEDGTWPQHLFSIDSLLLFRGNDPELGYELFSFDGSDFTVYDIYADSLSSVPEGMTEHQDAVYFAATDESGRELWRFGPPIETELVFIDPTLYPNPSTDFVTLNYGEWMNTEVIVVDNLGRIVDTWNQESAGMKLIDISNYRAGIYYLQLKSDDKSALLKLGAL